MTDFETQYEGVLSREIACEMMRGIAAVVKSCVPPRADRGDIVLAGGFLHALAALEERYPGLRRRLAVTLLELDKGALQ
jgi:hypothetical protein